MSEKSLTWLLKPKHSSIKKKRTAHNCPNGIFAIACGYTTNINPGPWTGNPDHKMLFISFTCVRTHHHWRHLRHLYSVPAQYFRLLRMQKFPPTNWWWHSQTIRPAYRARNYCCTYCNWRTKSSNRTRCPTNWNSVRPHWSKHSHFPAATNPVERNIADLFAHRPA